MVFISQHLLYESCFQIPCLFLYATIHGYVHLCSKEGEQNTIRPLRCYVYDASGLRGNVRP